MIALLQTAIVLFASMLGIRLAFFCFVFMLPFMPRYLGIAIGEGSLSARRIIILLLLLVFSIWVVQKHKLSEMVRLINKSSIIFSVLVFFSLVKIFSTLIESGVSNFLFVLDDLLFSVIIVLFTMMFIRINQQRNQLLAVVIASLLICEILSIAEFFKQAPLLTGFINIDVQGTDKIVEGLMRDGLYRAAALFDNPLLLSNFVCLAWPFSWYLYQNTSSSKLRKTAFFSLLLVPSTLFFVASRAGWLILTLTAFSMMLISSWKRLGNSLRQLTGLSIATLFMALCYFLFDVFQSPADYFNSDENSGVSALERINQYLIVADAFTEHPLIGYGMQRNIATDLAFLEHMDSYWLRLIVEGGLLAVLFFASLLALTFKRMTKLRKLAKSIHEEKLIIALMSSLIAFSVNLFFLTIPLNNIYLFIIVGVVIGWRIDEQPSYSNQP